MALRLSRAQYASTDSVSGEELTQEFEAFAAAETSDHEIQIFYRIDELPESAAMALLGQIEMCPGMPDDQKAALNGRYGSARIWKKSASSGVGHDFHNHVRELINGRKPELIKRLTLDDTARLFLSTPAVYEQDHEVRVCL